MLPIAWITLRRITEKAVLIQFGILGLVLVYVAVGLDAIVLNDATGIEQKGLTVAWLFLTAFTIFWTTTEIPREVGRKEEQVYLSKPVTRLQYLLGKFLGMSGMVVGGELLLLGVFSACLLLKGQRPSPAFWFGATRTALFLVLINALCTAASVVLVEVAAMVIVAIVALSAVVSCTLPVMAWADFYPSHASAMIALYHLMPDFIHYRWDLADGNLLNYLGSLALYTAGWSTLLVLAGFAMLRGRDLP